MPLKTSKSKRLTEARSTTKAKDKEACKARKIEKPETRDAGTQTKLRKGVPIKDPADLILQQRRDERRARRHRARLASRGGIAEIQMKAMPRYRKAGRATEKPKMGYNLQEVLEQADDAQADSRVGTRIGTRAAIDFSGRGGGVEEIPGVQAIVRPITGRIDITLEDLDGMFSLLFDEIAGNRDWSVRW